MQLKNDYSGFTLRGIIWDSVCSHPYSCVNAEMLGVPWRSCGPVVPSLILPLPKSPCNHRYFNRTELWRADNTPHSWRLVIMLEFQACGEYTSVDRVQLFFSRFSIEWPEGESKNIPCWKEIVSQRQPLSCQEGETYSSVIVAKPRGLVILTLHDTDIRVFYFV